ncbi:MAG: hypothetical protein K6G11_05540 [Lachnospiraceae bacterium]|nr:hypothetical protein [Lachnospiraceae bacterium]
MATVEYIIENEYLNPLSIALSGQCFRWFELEDGSVATLFGDCAVIFSVSENSDNRNTNVIEDAKNIPVKSGKDEALKEMADWDSCSKIQVTAWSKSLDEDSLIKKINNYLDMETDYKKIIDSIDTSDKHLIEASETGKGIRILRQDLWEIIISFMISQNNNIPRIQGSIRKICERFGKKIDLKAMPEKMSAVWPEELMYAFPEVWEIDENKLDGLGLGYREDYIRTLVSGLKEKKITPYECFAKECPHERLLCVKGIGNKVCACIELFGLHDLDAFPVDTWVKKIEKAYYDGRFPREKYIGTAGVMQQYLFSYERGK